MKCKKYLFLSILYIPFGFGASDKSLNTSLIQAAAQSPKTVSVPQTVTLYNKTPYAIYVLPSMAAMTNSLGQVMAGNYGNPMAGLLPANSMGAQFSFPSQVATVYFLTPSGVANYKKENPSVTTLNPKEMYQWISKGSHFGVYTTYPSPEIAIVQTPDGIKLIHEK